MNPVTSAGERRGSDRHDGSKPDAARADRRSRRNRVSRIVCKVAGFLASIERVDDLLRLAADRFNEAASIGVESTGFTVSNNAITILAAALGQVLRDVLPLAQVGINEPVDQLTNFALDLLRRIGDDLLLECLLNPAAIQQIEHSTDPHGVVEEVLASPLHLQQDSIKVRNSESEITKQIRLIDRELPLDLVERREVVLQERGALLDRGRMAVGQRRTDAERIEQLQADAAGRIERLANVLLERFEPAGRPYGGIALLRAQRETRADGKNLGAEPKQPARVVGHERANFLDLRLRRECRSCSRR